MRKLEQLAPEKVFYYFEEICNIPHGSEHTKAISEYLANFAKERNIRFIKEPCGNIIFFVPASAGYENAEPVIIQGHMDMVCEKESGCTKDMDKEGLDLYVEDGFVGAKDTTLGADDGIAVAYALALMDDASIMHPALEIVITIDEEIGMLGAADIDVSMLKGKKFINIDNELEGQILTGCAGGMSLNTTVPVTRTQQDGLKVSLLVSGLCGGHSGAEIDKERANATLVMGRVLDLLFFEFPVNIIRMKGGNKDNAIPRECSCSILIPMEAKERFEEILVSANEMLAREYAFTDANIKVTYEIGEQTTESALDYASVNKIIYYLTTVPNGPTHRTQNDFALVETSLNLGIFELKEEVLSIITSVRSSVSSRKYELATVVNKIVNMIGGDIVVEGDYPAWEYRKDSSLRDGLNQIYQEMYHKQPEFTIIHAGLECGIFSEKISDLDCVSLGPTIYDIHTPKERLDIASTKRVWEFLLTYLARCK